MSDLVVFSDTTDLDQRPAERILAAAGIRSLRLSMDDPEWTASPEAACATGMIVGYARIDRSVLARFPFLRVIATSSVGTEMVDAEAAEERGIVVLPMPGVAGEEVATHALALLLAGERAVVPAAELTRRGAWSVDALSRLPAPRRLSACTLAVIGMGRIGSALVSRAKPLYGRIVGFDPHVASWPDDVERAASAEHAVTSADHVSVHLPLTAQTHGIVSASLLRRMPSGTVLVNVARGELVDGEAVRASLADGRLRAYLADVLAHEPPRADDPLRDVGVVTPHIAWWSVQAERDYQEMPAQAIVEHLTDREGGR